MNHQEFEKLYAELCHFDRHLGMTLTIFEPGRVSYRLTVEQRHLSSPGACHGGVLAAMMDAVLGLTVLSWAVPREQLCATVELKTNFLTPAYPGDTLEGSAEMDFTGAKLVVASGEIKNAAGGELVAKGMGTFSLYPLAKKAHLADWKTKFSRN